jgi:hypothetical protein
MVMNIKYYVCMHTLGFILKPIDQTYIYNNILILLLSKKKDYFILNSLLIV